MSTPTADLPWVGLVPTFDQVPTILRHLESTGQITGRMVIRKVPIHSPASLMPGFESGLGWQIEEVRE